MNRSNRIPAKRIRVGSQGLAKFLGELEAQVMEEIWAREGATVREVWSELSRRARQENRHEPAYTTILTVMQNLEKKGYLRAERRGRQNFYTPCCDREEFLQENIQRAITDLLRDFPEYVIATLLPKESSKLSEEEREKFRRLLEQRVRAEADRYA